MSFLVLGGKYANHLARALVSSEPPEDPLFPLSGLYDYRANFPFRFSSVDSESSVQADLSAFTDPSFEVGVSLWTTVLGALTRSSTTANTGTYSALFTVQGEAYREFTARAGEQRQISAALYGGGGSVASVIRVYCVETGHFLQAGGASWAATQSDLFSRTTASWATSSQLYAVEPLSVTLSETVTLRVYVVQTLAGANTYRDDIVDIPATTWGSVHAHNLNTAWTVTFDSSPDAATWTVRGTPTLRRDSFYSTWSAIYARFWRIRASGQAGYLPWLGELVLGEHSTLTCAPDYPVAIGYTEPQERAETTQGAQHVYSLGGLQRVLGMSWRFRNDAEFQQVRDAFFRGGRGGLYPVIIVPTETDPDVCILGRTPEGFETSRVSYAIRAASLEVVEEPLALMA